MDHANRCRLSHDGGNRMGTVNNWSAVVDRAAHMAVLNITLTTLQMN